MNSSSVEGLKQFTYHNLKKSPESSGITETKPNVLHVFGYMLWKPTKAFEMVNDGRRLWTWLPALFIIFVLALSVYLRSYADSYYFYEEQLAFYAQNPENARFAPTEPTIAPLATILIRVGQSIAWLVGSWIFWAAGIALVSLLTVQGPLNFKSIIKLIVWCWIPYLMRSALQSIYMFITHDPIFNPGLSGLVYDDTPPSMGEFEYVMVPRSMRLCGMVLSHFDIYLIWQLILVWKGLPILTNLTYRRRGFMIIVLAIAWISIHVAIKFSQLKY